MNQRFALIDELDDAIAVGTARRRADLAERLADLFLLGSPAYSDDQIALFDELFIRLAAVIEVSARVLLAGKLARVSSAPPAVSRLLAFDDVIDVAAPILSYSERLDNPTLTENARTKGQPHLLAISKRQHLDKLVTDVLVERGDRLVMLSTSANPGACFSETGFATLVKRSVGDDELTGSVGLRRDLPRHHLLRLLSEASESVRLKLEAADPWRSGAIRAAISEVVSRVRAGAASVSRDYAAALAYVDTLQAANKLDDAAVAELAAAGKFEDTVVALAALCELPIERIELAMAGDRPETVLILGKAVGLSWPTVKTILKMRKLGRIISEQELDLCLGTFARLKPATAVQVMRFQRQRAVGEGGGELRV